MSAGRFPSFVATCLCAQEVWFVEDDSLTQDVVMYSNSLCFFFNLFFFDAAFPPEEVSYLSGGDSIVCTLSAQKGISTEIHKLYFFV